MKEIAVEQLRGIDPRWSSDCDASVTSVLVKARCDTIASPLLEYFGTTLQVTDVQSGGLWLGKNGRDVIFVHQLRGHKWCQIHSWEVALTDSAKYMSAALKTASLERVWEKIAGGMSYQLFDAGNLTEEYSFLHGNPMFDGVEGAANRKRRLAEGWQISKDNSSMFFTRRGTRLDIESVRECHGLLDRVATELEMYLAFEPLVYNSETGQLEFVDEWRVNDFDCVKVLWQIASPPIPADHRKLVL